MWRTPSGRCNAPGKKRYKGLATGLRLRIREIAQTRVR